MPVDFSKYGTPVIKTNTGVDFSKYGTVSSAPVAAAPIAKKEPEVKGGIVGEFLTGNTQRFGKTAGEALAAPKNAQLYADTMEQHSNIQNEVIKTIKKYKSEGRDSSRLEAALDMLVKSAPKIEDFTGDVINKTTEQVLGEAGGTVLEALSGGALSTAKKTVTSKILTTGEKVKEAAKVGAAYGAAGGATGAMQENKDLGGVITGTAIGAGTGAALGGGLGYGGAKLGQAIDRFGNRVAIKAEENAGRAKKLTGEILQGDPEDIERGQRVLSTLDPKTVKTYEQGHQALDDKVKLLSETHDALLATNPNKTKLNYLNAKLDVGNGTKQIKHNYVKDAFAELENFYNKVNDQVGAAELKALKAKASKEGMTVEEINNLAKLHGQKLNAYNASGELASGLSKQGAENTRAGLKKTVREYFGSEKSQAIDKEISDTIRVRDLFKDMTDNVNKLKQKIKERSLGAKAGYLVGKIINTIGLGSPKGIVESLIPRGQGFKTMNALDLEKALQKNIKVLQKITNSSTSEREIEAELTKFFNGLSTRELPATTRLPATPPKLK